MKRYPFPISLTVAAFLVISYTSHASAWFDETHLAIAKAAGHRKWFNAAGADMAKLKAGDVEKHNHYANNPPGTFITPEIVLSQVDQYNQIDPKGHLYGAIVASLRDYSENKQKVKYGEYHLAFCAHYVGDLSMPLHNTLNNAFNKRNHKIIEHYANDGVLDNLHEIKTYLIDIRSEKDLAKEIARIANLSMKLGYKMEAENRLLTKEEVRTQISHSVSLFQAILKYLGTMD